MSRFTADLEIPEPGDWTAEITWWREFTCRCGKVGKERLSRDKKTYFRMCTKCGRCGMKTIKKG